MSNRPLAVLQSVLMLVFCSPLLVLANVDNSDSARKMLPDRIGEYRATRGGAAVNSSRSARPGGTTKDSEQPSASEEDNLPQIEVSSAARIYTSAAGEQFSVAVTITPSDSHAYTLLTNRSPDQGESALTQIISFGQIGTAAIILPNRILFAKGSIFAVINRTDGATTNPAGLAAFARAFARTLAGQQGELPVLISHLPDWQQARVHAAYSVTSMGLKQSTRAQPIIDEVRFAGGAEAVTANYGPSQLVIVEFTTPQLAGDNDRRIVTRIQELWKQGQPAPTAYRRVGNYSVFVFNAPNEQTANQLIEQVKYEQVVQWLGENPNWLKEAQRRYTETTLGVFVSVVKASGVAAVLCFGIGGFFGALLFARRRAQQQAAEAYSDAGGMMRLNIDDLSVETNAAKLVGPGMSDQA